VEEAQERHPEEGLDAIAQEERAKLDEMERKMIRSILRLDETTVREVMVPRVDIQAVEARTPLAEVARRIIEGGHSRLPVYRETIDHILGIVHARDLLRFVVGEASSLEEVVRPALFVPESKRLDELLREFQEKRVQMAIVVDEYGGTAGLVTIEDLLEEIVGEIQDEFSAEEPPVKLLGEDEAVVDARLPLDALNELFSTQVKGEGFDTVGGFVYSLLGKMPAPGDEVASSGLRIRVLSTHGRRIRKLRVTRLREEETTS
jgi:CBS domain containing-hemolysin-like protein